MVGDVSLPAWQPHPDVWLLIALFAVGYAVAINRLGPRLAPAGRPIALAAAPGRQRWLWPGFVLELVPSEGESYWLNAGAPEPKVFVALRLDDAGATPDRITVSYNEAARWMDGGETVDGVAMPAEVLVRGGQHTLIRSGGDFRAPLVNLTA